ncbi:hypothetical protein GOBAR_AA30317 [Gossypium barbadense]|uniref:Uncharacterized protein n=1 Tax=Gossypium barbadense TaxID=3634 RepID=A0A2P5WH14_GOSBA|nr:hypothetical protein GOBAR_AA30317 [Gossypium barbadense]
MTYLYGFICDTHDSLLWPFQEPLAYWYSWFGWRHSTTWLNIMKHIRIVARQPWAFGDQYVLLHLTQQHEDDEHLDNDLPPPPRPIPSPPASHSTATPAYMVTLEDIYRLQQQQLERIDRIEVYLQRMCQHLHFSSPGPPATPREPDTSHDVDHYFIYF